MLEGWDTAGKGGVVRRLGWALDPRSFKVHTIAAPTEREKTLHYLQRFWERLPQHGQIVAFDRSWYGRVLVERVEGFATPDEWKRAYDEINDFERLLIADETRLVKLFLHITPEEQIRRFRNRLTDPLKRWKLSYEDFRNRTRWKDYEAAIEDMMQKTSTHRAPWHLIPANDKPYGRLAALAHHSRPPFQERLPRPASAGPEGPRGGRTPPRHFRPRRRPAAEESRLGPD